MTAEQARTLSDSSNNYLDEIYKLISDTAKTGESSIKTDSPLRPSDIVTLRGDGFIVTDKSRFALRRLGRITKFIISW